MFFSMTKQEYNLCMSGAVHITASMPTPILGITNRLLTRHFLASGPYLLPFPRQPEPHTLPFEEQTPGCVAPDDSSLLPSPVLLSFC